MKRKNLFIIILLLFVIGLSACSNKDASAAKKVDEAIDLIAETVTLDSKTAIDAARTAYDGLKEAQKALVKKYATLEAAELTLSNIVTQNAANPVIVLITDLPTTVTIEDEDQIVAARVAYNALTSAQKAKITTTVRNKLEDAEYALASLKSAAEDEETANQDAANLVIDLIEALPTVITFGEKDAVEEARTAYDALSTVRKALISAALVSTLETAESDLAVILDQKAADAVAVLIADLPATVTLEDQTVIFEARTAFDALTDTQEELVAAASVTALENAESALTVLLDQKAADAVAVLIADLPATVTLEDQTVIFEARTAFDALTDTQEELVAAASVTALENAEAALTVLLDQAAADAVEVLIEALPATVTLENQTVIVEARTAYDALTVTQKDLVTEANVTALENAELALTALLNKAAAEAVEALIIALPEISALAYTDEDAVIAARTAYDALTAAQQVLVAEVNVTTLEDAEAAMVGIMAQYLIDLAAASDVEDLISALPAIIELANETEVADAETAYNLLTSEQKLLVSNHAVLLAASARIIKLKDPEYAVIFAAITELGSRVTDDVALPNTVNWSLKAGEDDTVFDVATGKLLKNVFGVKEIVLIATNKTVPSKFEEVTINFGLLAQGETGLYYHDLSTYVDEAHWNGWTMTKVYTVGDVVKTDVLFHINDVVVITGESGSVGESVLTTPGSTTWSSAGSAILNAGPESISFALNFACGPNGFRVAVVVRADGTIKETSIEGNHVVTLEKDEFVWLARFLDANPALNLSLPTNFDTTTEMRLEKIQIPTFTVSFKIDEDTTTKVSVKEGAALAMPAAPIKAGFVFDGWYAKADLSGTAIVFPYTVTGGMTLYAKFTAAE